MRELERLILVTNLAAVTAVAMTATPPARLSSVTTLPRQGRVGQTRALGAMMGRITDEQRSPIPGGEITVREIARSVTSNDSGRFVIGDILGTTSFKHLKSNQSRCTREAAIHRRSSTRRAAHVGRS